MQQLSRIQVINATPNVQRKQKAAVTWCDRINNLSAKERVHANWHYVLLGESVFHEWHEKGALLSSLCDYARIRPAPLPHLQARLEA